MNLAAFQDALGYRFQNETLLNLALIHRSYAFEHSNSPGNNQRLEFLGDAILSFVIADELYRKYPNAQEGELTRLRSRLVCEAALCLLAKKLDFESHVLMSKGEVSAAGMLRPSTLADAYESVIGAIYLDGGILPAREFILHHHAELIANPDGDWLVQDAKTRLQDVTQAEHLDAHYEQLSVIGPDHSPVFEFAVLVENKVFGQGKGRTKKEAQQAAANDALDHWDQLRPLI